MFEQMNKHKYLDILEVGETESWDFRILIAEAGVIDDSGHVTPEQESNEAIRKILNESKPIEVTKTSKIYEVRFSEYIAYSVINESYASADESEEYEGELVRIYKKSVFLDYVTNSTFATIDYPGPFKHYGFCCLNHIVDVVSMEPRCQGLCGSQK